MGVPALFRWLSQKYPKIISNVVEELPEEIDGVKVPVDTSKPNPNGEEFDNLYLDMNGIVHPCSHPEDRPPPANEEEMMLAIFEYTERVVNMVRPRKLLMIAVDGVAPRAKMNQQRSRRFRSAQEAAEKDKEKAEFYAMLRKNGQEPEDAEAGPKKTWDSNAITPGTPFMDTLAASLRYWISYKLSTDAAWEKMKIIISDATVPGEGEHKIMSFIRSQRSSPTHDPNTRHVIYGLDADLIMLGLATHEPHFRVLREDVFASDTKPGCCRICNQPGHIAANCRGVPAKKPGEEDVEKPLKPFIWLHVSILREYLAVEMSVPNQPFKFDLERALDDWVFMCFFVGNDFLPHLPSLDIREQGIDTLITIWRDNIPTMGGYVTKDGHVDLARAQLILEGLSKQEGAIFARRRQNDLNQEAKNKRRQEMTDARERKRARRSGNGPDESAWDSPNAPKTQGGRGGKRGEPVPDINALPTFAPGQAQTRSDPRFMKHDDVVGGRKDSNAAAENRSAAAVLKQQLAGKNGAPKDDALASSTGPGQGPPSALGKRTRDMIDDAAANDATDSSSSAPGTPGRNSPLPGSNEVGAGSSGHLDGTPLKKSEETPPEDTVKLWEDGYEERYYEQKFHVAPDDTEFRHKVARSYVEGLAWVLLYYLQGCPSWTWYYPFHYAPFAADFVDMEKQVIEFDKGKPFRPYEQLMGVMPAKSNHTIPSVFHPLMTEEDSPIIEFYPEDFVVDLNGKKFAWQGVALLPFIDEKRLLDAMNTKYHLLSEDDKRRNEFGQDALLFSTKHQLYVEVATNFYSKKAGAPKFKLDTHKSEGLAGKIVKNDKFVPNGELVLPFENYSEDSEFNDLDNNESVAVSYQMPVVNGLHKSQLLAGVKFAAPVLDYNDVEATRRRADKTGRGHGGVQLTENGGRSDGRGMNFAARPPPQNGGYQGNNGYGANGGYGQQGGFNVPPQIAQRFPPPPPGMGYPPPVPAQAYGGYPAEHNNYGGYPAQQNGGYGGGRQNGGQQNGGQQNGGYGGHSNGYDQRGGYGGNGGYDSRGGYGQGSYNQGQGGYQNQNRPPPYQGGRRY